MRKLVNETKRPDYDKDGRLKGHWIDRDYIEVPDPAPTPAPVQPLRTNAQACAQCHQTACRCGEDLMPLSIMNARATVTNPAALDPILDEYGRMVDRQPASIPAPVTDKPSAPVTMSAEERAIQTANAEWDRAFYACLYHPNRLVSRDELTACSTVQLRTLYGQLERGQSIKEVLTDLQKAWTPKSILGIRQT